MRFLESHKVNGCNDELTIEVLDEPGSGGANHRYMVSFPNLNCNNHFLIAFQNGPIKEVGTNGLTHESLIAILIDRLEAFQSGPYKSGYNGNALHHLRKAQEELFNKTRERLVRNVEGTHTV